MTKAIKYAEWSQKVRYGSGSFRNFGEGDNWSGTVGTPHGHVKVQTREHGYTYLTFIYNERRHCRKYEKPLTRQGAVRKACEFAKQIAEGK